MKAVYLSFIYTFIILDEKTNQNGRRKKEINKLIIRGSLEIQRNNRTSQENL